MQDNDQHSRRNTTSSLTRPDVLRLGSVRQSSSQTTVLQTSTTTGTETILMPLDRLPVSSVLSSLFVALHCSLSDDTDLNK